MMAEGSYVPAGLKCNLCSHNEDEEAELKSEDLVWAGKGSRIAICRDCAGVVAEIFGFDPSGPGNTGPKVKKKGAAGTRPDQGDRPPKPPTV